VRYLGHATLLFEMGGLRLLTDPVLRNRVVYLRRRAGLSSMASIVSLTGATGVNGADSASPVPLVASLPPPDVVLISHIHHDHLDLPSLYDVGRDVPLLVPAGAGRWLTRRGFRHVEELRPGDAVAFGAVRVIATPAHHNGFRVPFGPRAGCLGFIAEGPQRIYFAGDTGLFAEMAALRPVDLALLPVGGWGHRLGLEHLDAARAVEALRLIHPAMAVPIHWGTLHPIGLGRWTAAPHARSPLDFAEQARAAMPDVAIRILQPGEALDLPPGTAPGGLEGSAGATGVPGRTTGSATSGASAAHGQPASDQAAQEDEP
jgi:L-ascorbate metabolism protein UlaG (beta-lactamase superfamily)